MNHSDIQARMADYLDGELSLESRALFDAHLDQCDPCSVELGEMRGTIRLLRSLPNPEPPPDLVSGVMRRIADGEGQPDWWGRILDPLSRFVVPRIAIPVSAVAAALALTVITGDLNLGSLNVRPVQPEPARVTIKITQVEPRVLPAPAVQQLASQKRVPSVLAADRSGLADRIPRLRYNAETGAGSILFRVGNDHRGPTRLQPKEGDFASHIFRVNGVPEVGPYLKVLMTPSFILGPGGFGLVPTSPQQGSGTGFDRGMMPVSVSRLTRASVNGVAGVEGLDTGEDLSLEGRRRLELDSRLGLLQEDPPGFAQWLTNLTLAEQELWLRELAARAESIGEVERVMSALEGSGDAEAMDLARGFEQAVERNRASWAAVEAVPSSR